MSYQLAVDLGTTHLSAAVARPDGTVEPAALGAATGAAPGTVPAVVHVDADGRLSVGESAVRRLLSDPDRVVAELVRRIGDRTPLVVGGAPVAAEALAARVVAHVARTVATTEGGPAAGVAVTHPASWGPHKVEAMRAALAAVGLDRAVLLTEAQAAAERHAAVEPLEPGAVLAVLDIGGGACDATVVRRDPRGFALLGRPERIERLGGADVDDVVFEHVRARLGERWDTLDPSDPTTLAAVAALRRDCTSAKEALSGSAEVAVPVALPGIRVDVELTRAALVELIRPALGEAVDLLIRVMEPVTLPGTPTVLLVGGSTRIPLVAELVAERTGLAVSRVQDPVTAVAAGAALAVRPAERPVPAPAAPVGSAVGPAIGSAVGSAIGSAIGSSLAPGGPGSRPDLDRLDVRPTPDPRPDPIGTGRGMPRVATLPATAPPPPPRPSGPNDPPGGVHPFRPERPARRRIPLVATVLAAVVAAAVLVGGLISLYRAGSITPTGSPAVASTPERTTPPPLLTTAGEPEPTAAPEQPRRQPAPAAPAPRPAEGPAPTTTAAPVTTTAAPVTQPPATTAPAGGQPGDGGGEGGDELNGDPNGGDPNSGDPSEGGANEGDSSPAPAGADGQTGAAGDDR
ncbi:Hsp70 family protein [Pseudonocardia humida]|uniref:Hsp70 family protein n=1 Tax=Pseudonocardia humida TaxID=2800819 RepID=A0ABT1AEK7_9PSEU|nr:Hsp70 family protein [Pseudonocardia humida]MCO1661174.1 Hsp70 family protein [Pseudonocardia humida]